MVIKRFVFSSDFDDEKLDIFNISCASEHYIRVSRCALINRNSYISGGVRLGDRCITGGGGRMLDGLRIFGDTTPYEDEPLLINTLSAPATCGGSPAKPLE